MAKRKRILDKIKLTEISGVDRPCQQGARVAIMKRAEPSSITKFDKAHQRLSAALAKAYPSHEKETEMTKKMDETMIDDELEGSIIDLEAQLADLNKRLAEAEAQTNHNQNNQILVSAPDFEDTVAGIRKRDGCSRTEALAKARKENAAGFQNYSAGPANDETFESLVAGEIAKGVADSVARQRVGLKYPNAAAAAIAKQGKHPFEKLVDAIMEQDGVSRSEAMARARKKEPMKFHHYQGG